MTQSDGWQTTIADIGPLSLDGRATAVAPSGEKIFGNSVGGLKGYKVDFKINWDNGHRSHYYGEVNDDASVTDGKRNDDRLQGAVSDDTTWTAGLRCLPIGDFPFDR